MHQKKERKKWRNKRTEVPQNHKCARVGFGEDGCSQQWVQIGYVPDQSLAVPLCQGPTATQSLRISQQERADEARDHLGIQRHTINNIKGKYKRTVKPCSHQIWRDRTIHQKIRKTTQVTPNFHNFQENKLRHLNIRIITKIQTCWYHKFYEFISML